MRTMNTTTASRICGDIVRDILFSNILIISEHSVNGTFLCCTAQNNSHRMIPYRNCIPFAETAQGLAKVHRTFSRLVLFCLCASNCIRLRSVCSAESLIKRPVYSEVCFMSILIQSEVIFKYSFFKSSGRYRYPRIVPRQRFEPHLQFSMTQSLFSVVS